MSLINPRIALKAALIAPLAVGACAALAIPGTASASALVDPAINTTLGDLPTTPACAADTGGDVDEEICLFVTNALTAWHHTATGPRLTGTGTKLYFTHSNDVAGGWAENYGVYWAGPFCAAATWTGWNVDGGNSSEAAGPQDGRDKCIGEAQGFTFGQRRQVQFWDDDSTASSGSWKLYGKVGGESFGQGVFRVANNDGDSWHGSPYCDVLNNRLAQWTTCGAIGATSVNGVLNLAAASDGIDAHRISVGFYVQDYPVAVKVRNDLPDSVFVANPVATPEHAMRDDAASTFKGEATAATGQSLWWVGYRERLGQRYGGSEVTQVKIPLTGTLQPSTAGAIREQWHGATVTINVKLGQLKDAEGKPTGGVDDNNSTCTIAETTASGAQAKCEVLAGTKGAPSHPAEVRVRIFN